MDFLSAKTLVAKSGNTIYNYSTRTGSNEQRVGFSDNAITTGTRIEHGIGCIHCNVSQPIAPTKKTTFMYCRDILRYKQRL